MDATVIFQLNKCGVIVFTNHCHRTLIEVDPDSASSINLQLH